MSDYIPETNDVRANYVEGTRTLHGAGMRLQDVYDEFDRWLIEHDRLVIWNYLREKLRITSEEEQ